jgi:hypothetical protein
VSGRWYPSFETDPNLFDEIRLDERSMARIMALVGVAYLSGLA